MAVDALFEAACEAFRRTYDEHERGLCGWKDAVRTATAPYVGRIAVLEAALHHADEGYPLVDDNAPLAVAQRRLVEANGRIASLEAALADATANHLDAPGGPRCACGLPSAWENGDCSRCGRLGNLNWKLAELERRCARIVAAGEALAAVGHDCFEQACPSCSARGRWRAVVDAKE